MTNIIFTFSPLHPFTLSPFTPSILNLLSSSFLLRAFVSILVPIPIPVNAIGVFNHAFAEGVTVNAQSFGGLGKIVVMAAENFKNEVLFKLLHGLVKENTASDHLVDNRFKFHFHRLPPEEDWSIEDRR